MTRTLTRELFAVAIFLFGPRVFVSMLYGYETMNIYRPTCFSQLIACRLFTSVHSTAVDSDNNIGMCAYLCLDEVRAKSSLLTCAHATSVCRRLLRPIA